MAKDTYNLLTDNIVRLMWTLAVLDDVPTRRRSETRGYKTRVGSSARSRRQLSDQTRRCGVVPGVIAASGCDVLWRTMAMETAAATVE